MGSFTSRAREREKAGQVTEVDRAILSLKTQRKKLSDYQKRTQAGVEREAAAVRRWVAEGDKQRALLALKKKRIQEDALQRADAWVLKIEQQLVEVEGASRQAAVVESLKVGQAAMAALQKELKLDDVEKLMDDAQDSKAHLQEVQAILDAHLSPEEEEAVLQELEELERELGLSEAPAPAPKAATPLEAQMPSVPTHTPQVAASAEAAAEEEEEEPGHERVREAPLAA